MLPTSHLEPDPAGLDVAESAVFASSLGEANPTIRSLLHRLLGSRILLYEEWQELFPPDRDSLIRSRTPDELYASLQRQHLLTPFQVESLRRDRFADLTLGQYRLLGLLGRGGMGTVYRGEHLHLRREVAVKVMTCGNDAHQTLVSRFYSEARAVAKLHHPNIVACFDAGRHLPESPDGSPRDYFVMEFINGQDLFSLVQESGPIAPQRACDLFRQIADALAEAHRHGLIHRDIKPTNILVTPSWQAKVLDFGLARVGNKHLTVPGTILGTIGYMAPEQALDPRSVDARADLFSLGATMYWALTGKDPFPETGNPVVDLQRRLTSSPPPLQQLRPELPSSLSDFVNRLMNIRPDARPQSAQSVAAVMSGFSAALHSACSLPASHRGSRPRVLLVDDDKRVRDLMATILREQYEVIQAESAEAALPELQRTPPDLLVTDVNLAQMSGPEFVEGLRAGGLDTDRLKVLMISGEMPADALGGLSTIADDFLVKPFQPTEFLSRVNTLLRRAEHTSSKISMKSVTREVEPNPQRALDAPEAVSATISRLLVETDLVAPAKDLGMHTRPSGRSE